MPDDPSAKISSGDATARGPWQPPSVEEAARLFPQYEVLGLIGRGGMGAVYQARQIALDRLVAIKLLPLEVSGDRIFADRFVREARAMGKLTHPNIVTVYDFGQTSEGHLYFAMEFVAGANLHAIIHTTGLTPDQALSISAQVCTALAYAHSKGVVHRDIKPANVMIDGHGHAKVADFGLARLIDPGEQTGHTQTGTVMGTPDYMAPEQKKGMGVDHRADIYSVGVMLYEMVCKETPQGAFEPASVRTGCDVRIDQIVLKAMQQSPDRRYQSTLEMKVAIDDARTPARQAPAPVEPEKGSTMLYTGIAAAVVFIVGAVLIIGQPKSKHEVVAAKHGVATITAATPKPVVQPPPSHRSAPPSPVAAAAPIEPGAKIFRAPIMDNGHRYQFFPGKISWAQAKARAEGMGAHLARIESAAELSFILKIYGEKGLLSMQCIWLDGIAEREGEWKWSDGTVPATPLESLGAQFDVGKTAEAGGFPAYLNLVRYTSDSSDRIRLNDHSDGETRPQFHWRQQVVGFLVEWDNWMKPALAAAPATPTPAPATPAPTPVVKEPSPTGKWIAEQEVQWQATYARDVSGPFEKGMSDLKAQYLAVIDSLLARATSGGKLEEAVFYRDEHARFDGTVPAEDEALCPAVFKPTRAAYRAQLARLEKERFERAKALHARIDPLLAQSQLALTQRQRLDEAVEMKTKREELAAAWLQPPASTPAPTVDAAAKPTTPAPMGTAMAAPTRGPKLKTREAVERLLALGAEVYLDSWKATDRVTEAAQVKSEKQIIYSVLFRGAGAAGKALAEEDFAIFDSLPELHRLTLDTQTNLTDSAFARLRGAKNIDHLYLIGKSQLTVEGFAILATFPNLQWLSLIAQTGCTDEAMAHVGACRALDTLFLNSLPITDAGLEHVEKLTNLTHLEVENVTQLTAVGFTAVLACKNLQQLALEGSAPAGVTERIAKHRGLTRLSLARTAVADADIAPLGALSSLKDLILTGTKVTGSVFAEWPARSVVTDLNLSTSAGQDDAALASIAAAFPKLQRLTLALAPGTTPAGIASLHKLRGLTSLTFSPSQVTDELLLEIGKLGQITFLDLGATTALTEKGVAGLAKLTALKDLHFAKPPVTEGALKSYARMRGLHTWRLSNQIPPADYQKLEAALPDVSLVR